MTSTIATLNETLLDDGQLKLGKKTTLPYGSFVVKEMPPTPELPFGYRKLFTLSPEWLASISHLSEEAQVLAKALFAAHKDAAAEAKMTPERREALRIEAEAVGEIQRKTLAIIAARKAAKEAAKDALKDLESE